MRTIIPLEIDASHPLPLNMHDKLHKARLNDVPVDLIGLNKKPINPKGFIILHLGQSLPTFLNKDRVVYVPNTYNVSHGMSLSSSPLIIYINPFLIIENPLEMHSKKIFDPLGILKKALVLFIPYTLDLHIFTSLLNFEEEIT